MNTKKKTKPVITFSVVIPTRKINDYIREAIPYHLNQKYQNFEIIILTEANEKEKFPKTRIIKVGQIPPSEKRNIGVEASRGKIIAFIDDDAYPEKDWLENAVKEFEDEKVVGVGGPGLVPRGASFFQKVSNEVYKLSSPKTGIRYGKGKRKIVEDWLTCNLFVRRKDFLDVGGFNSKYWGGEDTQVCYELTKNGKKIIYNPGVVVYHHPRKNLKAHLRQTLFWAMWRGFLVRCYPKDSTRLTFFAPSLLVLWLFFGGFLSLISKNFGYLYLGVFILYFIFLFAVGIRTKSLKLFFPVIFVMVLTQLIYGVGFLKGIVFGEPTKETFNPSEKIKIKQN
ncbi:glycosyltransferase [Candidatus Pacearchaeota archaeon]|nr:glycosyltransferase [Candidatus Pacearchaeota archaeon]